jgi:RNase P protein component
MTRNKQKRQLRESAAQWVPVEELTPWDVIRIRWARYAQENDLDVGDGLV